MIWNQTLRQRLSANNTGRKSIIAHVIVTFMLTDAVQHVPWLEWVEVCIHNKYWT